MSEVEHEPLPEGEWWACERPEAPSVPYLTHYRPKCRFCWPAFLATAAQEPNKRFIIGGQERAVYAIDDRLRDWFFRVGEFEGVGA